MIDKPTVKTSQGVYALGGLFIYVMYNVKNYECVTVTHSYLSCNLQ